MNMKRIFLFIGIALFLNSCTMIPKYTRPEAPVPSTLPSGGLYGDTPLIQGALPVADIKWQDAFPDEKLQKIIKMALVNNRDLKLAMLNVKQARALYGVQEAQLFPVINVTGGEVKKHLPADLSGTGKEATSDQYNVDLGITSWEIDFFGRIRSLEEQALQEYLSTEQAQRGVQTTLIGEVARIYFILAADYENFKLALATLDAQQSIYDMIKLRYDNGIATEMDLQRAQAQVDAAQGDIARYKQLTMQNLNVLNFLAGASVPDDLVPESQAGVKPPKDISAGLSSDVLLRRPDIMEAEHQLKSANAFIGAARAAFFPQISLTTAIGTASTEFSNLFTSASKTWNFSPKATMPIFDARTWAAYKVSKSMQEIAVTQYEKTIQTAFREVADALAVRATVDQQISAQASIVNSAEKVYELSNERYTQGIDGYLSVLDAQRTLYAAQQGLTALRLSKQANQMRFYTVLGGDTELLDVGSP